MTNKIGKLITGGTSTKYWTSLNAIDNGSKGRTIFPA